MRWQPMVVQAGRHETERTRVLIVEGHPIVRAVVRMACEASDALSVVGEAEDGDGAVEAVRALRPDVVVFDPALPGSDGFEVARRLRAEPPAPRILVLSDRTDGSAVLGWMRVHVEGLLPKASGVRTIANAIEAVAAGDRVFDPEQERRAIAELGRFVRAARTHGREGSTLTMREQEVLRLLADGLTIRQVASRTGVSPRTVESHVTKLYRKLGVRSRMQAVARAAALGLIDVTVTAR